MKRLLIGVCLLLAACTPTYNAFLAANKPDQKDIQALNRYGPDEFGVICYHSPFSSANLSCVYVGIEEKK